MAQRYSTVVPSSQFGVAADIITGGADRAGAVGGGVPLWNHIARCWEQHPLEEVASRFRASVDVRDRTYHFRTYKRCFVGSHAVTALYSGGVAFSRGDALRLGTLLLDAGFIEHCLREHTFKDEFLFYKFVDSDRGTVAVRGNRSISWGSFLTDFSNSSRSASFHSIVNLDKLPDSVAHVARAFSPMDECNVRLLDNVHPPEWIDPRFNGTYHLVVVGAGAAGLEAAAAASRIGAKVALIEANVLGGTTRNTGCVPSKALLSIANQVHRLRNKVHMEFCGITLSGQLTLNFEQVMRRVRSVRAQTSEKNSALRYTRKIGSDVFYGHAKFQSEHTILVAGKTIEFKRAIVCTGAYPSIPPIPGLRELYGMQEYSVQSNPEENESIPRMVMTNDNLFNMTTLPKRLCVLGSGVIAMELAQAMQRLGSQVTLFGRADSVLPNEERDMVAEIVRQMERDGVRFRLHVSNYDGIKRTGRVGADGRRELIMHTQERSGATVYRFDGILVASGRKPNVTGLNLEAANVDFDSRYGIKVTDTLQTSNARVFAVGDCCSTYKMAHAARSMARIVVRNALLMRREKISELQVPFVAYTTPELARVGPTILQMSEDGRLFDTVELSMERNIRARTEGDTIGSLRLFIEPTSGSILGAVVLGTAASCVVNELMVAMAADIKFEQLAKVIHTFPTRTDMVRMIAQNKEMARMSGPRKFRSSRKQSITA